MTRHEAPAQFEQRQLVDSLIRSDLYFFFHQAFSTLFPTFVLQRSAYIEAMCKAFSDASENEAARLLVNVPPRYLKSTIASVALPAFFLGQNPGKEVMVATYSAEFATLHANQFRMILEADWFRRIFPAVKIDPRNNRADEVRLQLGGGRKAVAVGGSVTGRGADILIVDDILKAGDARSDVARRTSENFFEETLISRLNDKRRSSIIVVSQRLHEDDFSAYLLAKGGYRHFNLPAIATQEYEELPLAGARRFIRRRGDALCPERDDVATLRKFEEAMTRPVFSAQYQQEPVPVGGNEFDFDGIATIPIPPTRIECAPVVQSWDPAFTTSPHSDFSVCTTWGLRDGKWYLLDVDRARLTYPDLVRKVIAHKAMWNADHVIVEGGGSGTQLVQQLRRDHRDFTVLACKTGVANKEARLIEQSARLLDGRYVVPTSPDWYRDLRQEFRAFPNGRNDDQVDSVSQFVAWANSRQGLMRTGTAPEFRRRQEHEIHRR